MVHWWLNVFFLVNGNWMLGADFVGWAPLELPSQEMCIERKTFAEEASRVYPLPYLAEWICSANTPLRELPQHLRGLMAEVPLSGQ